MYALDLNKIRIRSDKDMNATSISDVEKKRESGFVTRLIAAFDFVAVLCLAMRIIILALFSKSRKENPIAFGPSYD